MLSLVNHFAAAGIKDFGDGVSVELALGLLLISNGLSGMKALLRKSSMSIPSISPKMVSTGGRDLRAEEDEAQRRRVVLWFARSATGLGMAAHAGWERSIASSSCCYILGRW